MFNDAGSVQTKILNYSFNSPIILSDFQQFFSLS